MTASGSLPECRLLAERPAIADISYAFVSRYCLRVLSHR